MEVEVYDEIKKSIVMRGALLRPLVIGQGALLHAGGKIYHTSRRGSHPRSVDDMVRLKRSTPITASQWPLFRWRPATRSRW